MAGKVFWDMPLPMKDGMRPFLRMKRWLAIAMVLGAACGSTGGGTGAQLTVPQMKFAVIDSLGKPAYCDPDFYPIARIDGEQQNAISRYPQISADTTTYAAIVAHEHLPSGDLSDEQKLTVYRAWKLLRALGLTASGSGYTFDYTVAGSSAFEHVVGTVTSDGTVHVASRSPGKRPMCPICLAASTLIDTPAGSVRVTDLRSGQIVWTLSANGSRIAMPVVKVGSIEAPVGHRMVDVALADGRKLLVSPGHRTADGRQARELRVGETLDGSVITKWELVPYTGGRTYDLLPAGATGFYWANGILMASTLSSYDAVHEGS